MKCVNCKTREVYKPTKGNAGSLCAVCLLDIFSQLSNPECEWCLGQGRYYWHSDDCDSDDCVLAGGYDDCIGQMVECDCSILDLEIIERANKRLADLGDPKRWEKQRGSRPSDIVDSLVAAMLKKHLAEGGKVEIPSLGITIGDDGKDD